MPVVFRCYPNALEAHLAKAQLAAAGIEALLHDEHTVTLNWLYSDAVGGVKLLVLAEHIAAARACLDASYDTEEADPELSCTKCGGQLGDLVKHQTIFALSWLLKGFPLWPIRYSRDCVVCKKRHWLD
jgi:hypothetical protein